MDLQKGLVGHWSLDAGATSDGTAYDRSAYDNHGTINGPTETTGLWGTALDFTQSNSDYIITNGATLSGDPVATLSVWAKGSTTNQTDWTGILSLGTDQSTNTTFTINTGSNGNNIEVHTWGNSTASVPLDDTNWHHYVGINTGDGTQEFYVDGNFIGSMSNTLSIPAEPSVIGARKYAVEDNNSRFWDGKIQDARIYNRVLSEDEIRALYNMRSTRAQKIKSYKLRPRPGDDSPNLMDATSWTIGTRGSQTGFSDNGGSQDNVIIKEDTPYGDIGPVWHGYSSDPSDDGSDGGWAWYGLDDVDIDETKPYRYSVWMKQESFDGKFYHGTERVDDFNGNHQGNPYYDNGNLPSKNDWYLVVGYNQPKSKNSQTYDGGIFDRDGNKMEDTTDFRWDLDGGGDSLRWRSYYYYDSTNDNRGVKFYDPRLEIIDGNHTTLTEMFAAANDFSNRMRHWYEQFDAGVFSPRWTRNNGNSNISSDRSYTGANSFGSWGNGTIDATWEPFDEPQQISEFEYVWKEDGSNTGHVVALNDSNGNVVQESGTENPQWYLNNGSGGRVEINSTAGTNYNVWTRYYFDFDWQNGEYDYVMEKLDDSHTETGTQQLENTNPINHIRFADGSSLNYYGSANYCRFDNITVRK